MNELMTNPAFHTYAVCACILAIKMLLTGNYTSVVRMRTKGFVNVEDAKAFGGTPSEQEHPAVAHALRIQRNDGENIPLFFAIGLVPPESPPADLSSSLLDEQPARSAHAKRRVERRVSIEAAPTGCTRRCRCR